MTATGYWVCSIKVSVHQQEGSPGPAQGFRLINGEFFFGGGTNQRGTKKAFQNFKAVYLLSCFQVSSCMRR